jgi:hypothetical protein
MPPPHSSCPRLHLNLILEVINVIVPGFAVRGLAGFVGYINMAQAVI